MGWGLRLWSKTTNSTKRGRRRGFRNNWRTGNKAPRTERQWRDPEMPQAPVAGTIISVTDGDEVRADVEGFGITEVRFAYVDAPEYDQAGGAEAKDALKALVNRPGTKAKFAVKKRDKYGRLIATVFTAGVVLEEVLLEQGHAWAMKKYLPPVLKERYAKLENEARRDKRGLWGTGRKTDPTVGMAPARDNAKR